MLNIRYNLIKGCIILNEFTLKILNKGWSVVDALERWNYSRDTYDRWRADSKYHDRLNDLIDGLEKKEAEE